MTLYEFIQRLTEQGTKCRLPNNIVTQKTSESFIGDGAGGRSGWTVVNYTSESPSEKRRNEALLERITLLVLNCKADNASIFRLYKMLFSMVPKDFRNGLYEADKEKWQDWILAMSLTIASELSAMMLRERHCGSANVLLKALQCRIDAWGKMSAAKVTTDTEAKRVTVEFGSF